MTKHLILIFLPFQHNKQRTHTLYREGGKNYMGQYSWHGWNSLTCTNKVCMTYSITNRLEAFTSKYYIYLIGHDKRGVYCSNEQ